MIHISRVLQDQIAQNAMDKQQLLALEIMV